MNALHRSKNTAPATPPSSSLDLICSTKCKVAVSVEWFALKPNCIQCRPKLLVLRHVVSCLMTTFSATFESTGSILIGL